jgi:hypothetical protein
MENELKQAVVGPGRGRLEVLGNEDGYDERVDGDNAGHDDRDEALSRSRLENHLPSSRRLPESSHLHDQVRPEGSHASNANAGFCGAIRCPHACR